MGIKVLHDGPMFSVVAHRQKKDGSFVCKHKWTGEVKTTWTKPSQRNHCNEAMQRNHATKPLLRSHVTKTLQWSRYSETTVTTPLKVTSFFFISNSSLFVFRVSYYHIRAMDTIIIAFFSTCKGILPSVIKPIMQLGRHLRPRATFLGRDWKKTVIIVLMYIIRCSNGE